MISTVDKINIDRQLIPSFLSHKNCIKELSRNIMFFLLKKLIAFYGKFFSIALIIDTFCVK